MAPSPSVFLAAVAQRTKRLRFGTIGLRAAAASSAAAARGNLHARSPERRAARHGLRPRLGAVSRSPITARTPEHAPQIYAERLEVILQGVLTQKTLSARTARTTLRRRADGAGAVAEAASAALVRRAFARQRRARRAPGPEHRLQRRPALPRAIHRALPPVWREVQRRERRAAQMGMVHFIVVADSDDEPLAIARRAYLRWRASFCTCTNCTAPRQPRRSTWRVSTRSPSRAKRSPARLKRCARSSRPRSPTPARTMSSARLLRRPFARRDAALD